MQKARKAIENLMFEKYREKARRDRSALQQLPDKLDFPGGV